jgi:hypothetical protein
VPIAVDPVATKGTEKLEVPAIVKRLKDDVVVEKSLAEVTPVELNDDDPNTGVLVGNRPEVNYLAEDESVGPEPATGDDVDSARKM